MAAPLSAVRMSQAASVCAAGTRAKRGNQDHPTLVLHCVDMLIRQYPSPPPPLPPPPPPTPPPPSQPLPPPPLLLVDVFFVLRV
ncbi:hypothetical protein C0Q70_18722 [Pomacea canaliculata]|uniref:Uncharacterized protein n=1 Tax=Pomacea canaliculata TaxID=400727 RepID=A0A2T7NHD7_POMCA|nr:hypothetical protein C0Q70_18722 [Pomacea canaliculata]